MNVKFLYFFKMFFCCDAYSVVGFRSKNHKVTVRKKSRFVNMVLSTRTQLDNFPNSRQSIKNIDKRLLNNGLSLGSHQFCCPNFVLKIIKLIWANGC